MTRFLRGACISWIPAVPDDCVGSEGGCIAEGVGERSGGGCFGVVREPACLRGVGGVVLIACLGAMYAVVALRLGNLRAVIVAHVLQDFLAFVLIMTRHLRGA